jgi:Icc-related predicted phosphoesterase
MLLMPTEARHEISNAHLLINSGVELDGIKIWGSPATNLTTGAFAMPDDRERAKTWKLIPTDTDILVTHIPPFGILDGEPGSAYHSGCSVLRAEFKRIRPRLHVFGHVHTAAGVQHTNRTVFVNASLAGPLGDLDKGPTQLFMRQTAKSLSRDHELERPTRQRYSQV